MNWELRAIEQPGLDPVHRTDLASHAYEDHRATIARCARPEPDSEPRYRRHAPTWWEGALLLHRHLMYAA